MVREKQPAQEHQKAPDKTSTEQLRSVLDDLEKVVVPIIALDSSGKEPTESEKRSRNALVQKIAAQIGSVSVALTDPLLQPVALRLAIRIAAIPETAEAARDMVVDNIPVLEKNLLPRAPQFLNTFTALLNSCVLGDSVVREPKDVEAAVEAMSKVQEAFARHKDSIRDNLCDMDMSNGQLEYVLLPIQNLFYYKLLPDDALDDIATSIIYGATPEQSKPLKEFLTRSFRDGMSRVMLRALRQTKLPFRACTEVLDQCSRKSKHMFGPKVGLHHSVSDGIYIDLILRELATLKTLGGDAASELNRLYGIRMFNRYGEEFLKEQYRLRDDAGKPFIIVLTALDDWNNAYGDKDGRAVLAEATQRLDKMGYRVIAIEARNLLEMVAIINGIDEAHGDKFKSEALWVRAHGHRKDFSLGPEDGEDISIDSLESLKAWKEKRRPFAPAATLILDGCMLGKAGAFGERSTSLFNTVIGLPTEGSIVQIEPWEKNGSLEFKADYYAHTKDGEKVVLGTIYKAPRKK